MAPQTFAFLTPESASFPSTNFAPLVAVNDRLALAFDTTTEETAYWIIPAIDALQTPLTIVITYAMQSATSGSVVLGVAVEAISDGDTVDTDSATSFATVNNSASTTVPGTAGYIDQITITLTNNDSIAPLDYARISIARRTADAGDTATGDLYFYGALVRYDDGT